MQADRHCHYQETGVTAQQQVMEVLTQVFNVGNLLGMSALHFCRCVTEIIFIPLSFKSLYMELFPSCLSELSP